MRDRPIRRLDLRDVAGCVALALDRNWRPLRDEWRMLLTCGEGYGIDAPDGGLAGAVVVTPYEDALAAVGKLLVATRYGGRGLGRRLTEHVMERAGGRVPILYATTYGRPLYLKLGYRDFDNVVRHAGEYRPAAPATPTTPATSAPRPATRGDLPAIAALDREAMGVDRRTLLEGLYEHAHGMATIDGRGFAAFWQGDEVRHMGPVIARDDEAARSLIDRCAAGAPGPVTINLAGRHAGLAAWLTERGLGRGAAFPLMVYGGDGLPGDRDLLYAPVTLAVG